MTDSILIAIDFVEKSNIIQHEFHVCPSLFMLIRDDMVLAGGSKTSCSQEKTELVLQIYGFIYILCTPFFTVLLHCQMWSCDLNQTLLAILQPVFLFQWKLHQHI